MVDGASRKYGDGNLSVVQGGDGELLLGEVPVRLVRNVGGLAYYHEDSAMPVITNCVFWGNVEKTEWPFGNKFKGVPGIYWHPTTPLQDLIKIGTTVVEGGTDNADVAAVLEADATGESSRLTALTAQKGPGFKDAAKGDWTLRRSSVLVDVGVKAD